MFYLLKNHFLMGFEIILKDKFSIIKMMYTIYFYHLLFFMNKTIYCQIKVTKFKLLREEIIN